MGISMEGVLLYSAYKQEHAFLVVTAAHSGMKMFMCWKKHLTNEPRYSNSQPVRSTNKRCVEEVIIYLTQSDTSKVITRQRLAQPGEQLHLEMVREFWFLSEKCC